jgi:fructokinase
MSLYGVDLGGTKIEGAVVDPARPDTALIRLRVPTESAQGYRHVLGQVTKLIGMLEKASGTKRPAQIGIGTPGVTDPSSGVLKNSNTLCLTGQRLREDLGAALGVEARLANDANCFALAEASFGAGRGRPVVVGLILGTGCGGGVVVNGQVLEGLHGIAGEWGHNPLRGETTLCYCGHRGCIENVISGPALEGHYREKTGRKVPLPEIVRRAGEGEAAARGTLRRLQNRFGEAIAAVINILDPQAVVIGGGVGNIDLLYTEGTRQAVLRHLFNPVLRTEFLRPTLGDSAGVFGAAMLTAGSKSAGRKAGSPPGPRIRSG